MTKQLRTTAMMTVVDGENSPVHQKSAAVDLTNGYKWSKTVVVGTSEESVSIAVDSGSMHSVWLYNRDATNFVTWGTATGVRPFKLRPGQAALVGLDGGTATLYLQADTAAVEVEAAACGE